MCGSVIEIDDEELSGIVEEAEKNVSEQQFSFTFKHVTLICVRKEWL